MPSDPGPGDWSAPAAYTALDAEVTLPGSKSLTNRFLVLAALAADVSRLRAPLRARDTLLMADGLRTLGVGIEDVTDGDWLITPGELTASGSIDCGLAGNVMRFLPPVAALARGTTVFDGDPAARRRPMAPVLDGLRLLGATIDDGGRGVLPFTIEGSGRVRGGQVTVDASGSSQFVSGLLLAGARFDRGLTLRHVGDRVPSLPHIEMTIEVLRDAGVVVDDTEPDTWQVEPGPVNPLDVHIEPDLSAAAPFLAAALVSGGRVHVPGWPRWTTQGGDAIRHILERMGGKVELDRTGLTVAGGDGIRGIDIDLRASSELTPVVAALMALADSPGRIRGISHIRGHETDRIAALATEINALGGRVSETEDGLAFVPAPLRAGLVRTHEDHRMVMAAAVLALAVPGLIVENVATVAKTLPTFPSMWSDLLSQNASALP